MLIKWLKLKLRVLEWVGAPNRLIQSARIDLMEAEDLCLMNRCCKHLVKMAEWAEIERARLEAENDP